jgi:hypothetical protein
MDFWAIRQNRIGGLEYLAHQQDQMGPKYFQAGKVSVT